MKLQDLDKTKRYDLSECTDEELLCVLNWLKENDRGWETYTDIEEPELSSLGYDIFNNEWYVEDILNGDIKPTFIQ